MASGFYSVVSKVLRLLGRSIYASYRAKARHAFRSQQGGWRLEWTAGSPPDRSGWFVSGRLLLARPFEAVAGSSNITT